MLAQLLPAGARRLCSLLLLLLLVVLFAVSSSSSPPCGCFCRAEAALLLSRSRSSHENPTSSAMIRGQRGGTSVVSSPPPSSPLLVETRRRRPLLSFQNRGMERRSSSILKIASGGATADPSSDAPEKKDATTTITPTRKKNAANLFSSSAASLLTLLPPASELLGECCGTFLIVQLGTAAVMSAVYTESLMGLGQIAAVWSTAVTVAIGAFRQSCPAHFNPAVSLAFACVRPDTSSSGSSNKWGRLRQRLLWRVIPYSLAQLLGAALGSAVNLALYGSTIRNFEAARGIVRSSSSSNAAVASAKAFGQYFTVPVAEAVLAEGFGTAVLAAVIFALTHPDNKEAASSSSAAAWMVPALIGATVGALICCLAPLTQAGFNPARDLGPRLVAWAVGGWHWQVAFQRAWVYLVPPCAGAVLGAALVDQVLYCRSSGGTSGRTDDAEGNKSKK